MSGGAGRAPDTLRVGLADAADLDFFGDTGQRERFGTAHGRVAGRVAACLPFDPGPLFEAGDLLYRGPWVAERLADLGDFLTSHPDSVLPVTRRVLESGWRPSAVEAFRARHRLQELRGWARRLFTEVDVLVLPTIGTTYSLDEIAADPIGRNLDLGRYTQFANLLDLAAVTLPNGTTPDGRPASITLLGPAFSDATLVRLAVALQQPDRDQTQHRPVERGPVEHRPVEHRPVEHRPVEHRPVERRPAERRPVGPDRRSGTVAWPAPQEPATRQHGEAVETVTIAVVGLHLSGEPRNAELTDRAAVLVGPARTAACYRLYRLPGAGGGLPGLVRTRRGDPAAEPGADAPTVDGAGGGGIEVELWELPLSAVGGLLAGVPAPLSLGRVRLADGREVLGFLCEAYAAGPGAQDITAGGGWRAYRAGRAAVPEPAPPFTGLITTALTTT